MNINEHIYHISSRQAWQTAQAIGQYEADSLRHEGFIHCSTQAQVLMVANAFYRAQSDLVILCIRPESLQAELIWEAPVHPNPDEAPSVNPDSLFPHIYGPINLGAVVDVLDFPHEADGQFLLPPALRQ